MVFSSLFAAWSLALVVGVASMASNQEAAIERDGTIQSIAALEGDEAKLKKLKPLLRKFIQSLPQPYMALPQSASDRFPKAFSALHELDTAYQGHVHDPFFIKVNLAQAVQTMKDAGEPRKTAVYGEVQPMAFVQLLDRIDAHPGMRFYDLGSGNGKTVIMAGLLGFNATGVELVEERFQASCAAMVRARRRGLIPDRKHGTDVSFERASLLDVDVSDADIVFTDSVLFTDEMMEGIAKRVAQMKPGAKIISANGIPGPSFKDFATISAPSSWSDRSKWKVQEVSSGASITSLLALPGRRVGADPATSCSLSDPEGAAAMLDKRSTSLRATLGFVIFATILLLNF